MKFTRIFVVLAATMLLICQACEETNNIGASLVKDQMEIVIDSTFVVGGRSVENHRIQSRTITQVLGKINAEEYGSFESEFVTQFMSAATVDTVNVKRENIDSLRLIFRIPNGDIVGDSLLPMGLEIYPLTKTLPSPIFSDFDPEGYYNPADKLVSKIYKCNAVEEGDTLMMASSRYVTVKLPQELARNLYDIYKENPANYATPQAFSKKFPGFYIRNSYGSGRVMRIAQTVMRMYYHKDWVNDKGNDTTARYVGFYYAVQPEIITNNLINYKMGQKLIDRLNAGENLVVAPAGRDIEIDFPLPDIISKYKEKAGKLAVLNTLTFNIPAYPIENEYGINPPATMLMLLAKEKERFFINNDITDDVTSFVGTYDSVNKEYSFPGMRQYLIDMMKKENLTPEDYTFILTPVSLQTVTETSTSYYYYYTTPTQTVTGIVPYVGAPCMAQIRLDKAKIKMTLSKQVTNF